MREPTKRLSPDIDEQTTIGDPNFTHMRARLDCIRLAQQIVDPPPGVENFGEILYAARHIARFVLDGRTPELRFTKKVKEAVPAAAEPKEVLEDG